jgi:hypothetical protein
MKRILTAASFSIACLATLCTAQSRCAEFGSGTLSGQTYSNEKLGLSYTFPSALTPADLRSLPQTSDGNGMILLALWKNPREFDKPSILIMTDDPSAYPDRTAIGYLRRIERTVVGDHAAKVLKSDHEHDLSGVKFYRLDYQFPGPTTNFNTAITGQLEGCEISFQLTARTQQEIDTFVQSLSTAKIVPAKMRRPKVTGK